MCDNQFFVSGAALRPQLFPFVDAQHPGAGAEALAWLRTAAERNNVLQIFHNRVAPGKLNPASKCLSGHRAS